MRGLLAPAIAATVQALLHRHLSLVVAMFMSATDAHKWVAMPVVQQRTEAADNEVEALLRAAYGFMSHPPLAVFVNAVRSTPLPCLHYASLMASSVVVLNPAQRWSCL
jgi:hypothetical protein